MSRVLLVTSVLALLPFAAHASSIISVPAHTGEAPSIIERGTPAEPEAQTAEAQPAPRRNTAVRDVTPMLMRGGVTGEAPPPRADPAPAEAIDEFE